MTALFLQTLLLMAIAYFAGTAIGCFVHALFTPAAKRRGEPAQAVAGQAPAGSDDLTLIRAIDGTLHSRLNKLGVRRFAEIASWKRADIDHICKGLGLNKGHIEQQNWIEQAQILAGGGETKYSSQRKREQAAPVGSLAGGSQQGPSQQQLTSATKAAEESGEQKTLSPLPTSGTESPGKGLNSPLPAPATHAEEAALAAAPHAAKPAPAGEAVSGPNGATVVEYALPGPAHAHQRVVREVSPARRPVKLVDAIREHAAKTGAGAGGRADLASFRSVRSEAYRNIEADPEAQAAAAQTKVVRSAVPDDLKRIRGIGLLIEKRLNAMGIVSYEQIANWSADDIERISRSLAFKDRIERENWVEQARILAAGGHTEFSRRLDRSGLEEGKPRL
jgi:predicted flap endonuclease-1-like 5' DNA nuclease